MTFIKRDLPEGSRALKRYLTDYVIPLRHKQDDGDLVSVFNKSECIENIQARIKRHATNGRYNKNIPQWENFIEILKELK